MIKEKPLEKQLEKQPHNYAMLISVVVVIAIIAIMIAVYRPDQPIPTTTTSQPDVEEPSVTSTTETTTTTQPETETEEYIVKIINFRFVPETLTINVGDTVTWINEDMISGHVRPHKVKELHNEFISDRLYENDTISHTFKTAGTYTYIDAIFTTQVRRGTIIVADQQITGNFVWDIPASASPMIAILALVILAGMVTGYLLGLRD